MVVDVTSTGMWWHSSTSNLVLTSHVTSLSLLCFDIMTAPDFNPSLENY